MTIQNYKNCCPFESAEFGVGSRKTEKSFLNQQLKSGWRYEAAGWHTRCNKDHTFNKANEQKERHKEKSHGQPSTLPEPARRTAALGQHAQRSGRRGLRAVAQAPAGAARGHRLPEQH